MQLKDRVFIMVGFALVVCLIVVSAELNALAFYDVIDNQSVAHAPIWLMCLFTLVLAALPFLWFPRLSPIKALLSICVYIVIVIALVFFMAYFMKLWLAPAGAIFSILLTYPLWSCAKLNSAQVALDQALQNLQDELTRMGMEQESEQPHHEEDAQRARIHKLTLTAKHLRDMHKSRSDALIFISHDIRAPLGAAMLLLQKFQHNMYSERMRRLLERAHTLAEGFLQASRAEMSDVNKYHELDFVSLAQQVIDDHYEQLNTKKIRLETKFPDDVVWIRGDFGLLFRAVSNVLLNAVNYSPEQSVIKILIDKDEVMACLRVIDQGPGIPEDKIQQLFKRFSRADGEHQVQSGSGLGLYFVGITIRKHRGTVSVENVQSPGAEFVISIPLERRKNNIPVTYDRRVKPELTFEDNI